MIWAVASTLMESCRRLGRAEQQKRTLADVNVDRGVAPRFSQSLELAGGIGSAGTYVGRAVRIDEDTEVATSMSAGIETIPSCQRGCQNFGPVVWCLTGRISSRECLVPRVDRGSSRGSAWFLGEHASLCPCQLCLEAFMNAIDTIINEIVQHIHGSSCIPETYEAAFVTAAVWRERKP